jgi:putative transposase
MDRNLGLHDGFFQKNLYDILGSTSIKTLRRWHNELGGASDWTRVVPLNLCKKENGSQLSKDEQDVFLGFLLNPRKLKIETAVRLTKTYLKNKGIHSDKSPRTFRRFAERYKSKNHDVWVLARDGQKALKDKVIYSNKRDPSHLEVGQVLVADGHRLNFQIINPFTGKPCRAVLVGFLDWKSYDLAGYEIMIEENTQCIASALRNSIIRLGKIPQFTYQDNGKAFR